MSMFERTFAEPPPASDLRGHPAHERLRLRSRRLRRRLLEVNATAGLLTYLLTDTLNAVLPTPLVSGFTLGMLILCVQTATMLISTAWYDRACAAHCDRHVDALVAAVHDDGSRRVRP